MGEEAVTVGGAAEERAPNEERRASVRLPSSRAGYCRPAGGDAERSVRARVRDISTLGIALVFPRPPELGALLEIDLEGPGRKIIRTLLARVVHAEAEADGWVVGCAFTMDLVDADLKLFQAERARPAPGDGRRWMRFPCNVETVCTTCLTVPGERSAARILNISAGGIGLLLPCQFDPGTLLYFEMPAHPGRMPRKLLVRVVRAFERTNGDWFLGCEFAQQLREDEVLALL